MADVLSQSQIDALLKSMSADAPAQEKKTESVQPLSPEEKNYIKYDFFSPRKFKRKMKILRRYLRIMHVFLLPRSTDFPCDDGHNGAGCTGKKVLRIRKCPSRKRLYDNDRRINSRRRKMRFH